MRLKRIKLAGFKSFVEPTSVSLPHNLIGVVGPNGCGKSNIIDAVRWVMGESSAKYLRGESMEDVIFNGSSTRKPVGKAFVELIFDNTDGRVEGAFAQFAEINVRREVSRDGQSKYFLNKSRCRRRDVMDLFLGTGLGPRSYSIIEQGMVNRIIEARPEELRLFVEEAAGISKYKDRRRETENRIRHSRENLERVQDIREELERQLRRLQRQSRTAERYRELKQKERELKSQLGGLRWQALGDQLQQHERDLASRETELEEAVSRQRQLEREIEESRGQLSEGNQKFNTVQAEFYEVSANIARIEQNIKHIRQRHEERRREKEGLERAIAELRGDLDMDREKSRELEQQSARDEAELNAARQDDEQAAAAVRKHETELQGLQEQWETWQRARAERRRAIEVRQVEQREAEQRLQRRVASESRLAAEYGTLSSEIEQSDERDLGEQARQSKAQAEALQTRLKSARARRDDLAEKLDALRNEIAGLKERRQSIAGRLQSLQEMQEKDLGGSATEWAASSGLDASDLLHRHVHVEKGWEKALDRVLGSMSKAWIVDHAPRFLELIADAPDKVALVTSASPAEVAGNTLLARLGKGAELLAPLLEGVYAAEDLTQAITMRDALLPHERVVTRDGCLVGANWARKPGEETAGVLFTASRIEELRQQHEQLQQQVEEQDERRKTLDREISAAGQLESELRGSLNQTQARSSGLQAELARVEVRREQTRSRMGQLHGELAQLRGWIAEDNDILGRLLAAGESESPDEDGNGETLAAERAAARHMLDTLRGEETRARNVLHGMELGLREKQTRLGALKTNIERLQRQLSDMDQRREQVMLTFSEMDDPVAELQSSLEGLLTDRMRVQQRLDEKRNHVAVLEEHIRKEETRRNGLEQAVERHRAGLEEARMERQELTVRRDTLREQMLEHGSEPEQVCAALPAELQVEEVEAEAGRIAGQIGKLGPVNLAAIDEYEETKQRKAHLDSQYDDLTRALDLLEESIRKINRETRTRFKETFDKINTGFQQFFPKLFGGGHATLELTGDDMLDAGVTAMARPPGKRNSTIQLLSGGEKALTAVSLVFAIFELNPAPFCLLDEVDAPLDDANVHRYTEILTSLSNHSQLIFITHNKITMDAADILVGVTMGEPGVSRLVAVDIDQAVEMAARAAG